MQMAFGLRRDVLQRAVGGEGGLLLLRDLGCFR